MKNQGEQHYAANSYFNQLEGGFTEQVERDRLQVEQWEVEFEMIGERLISALQLTIMPTSKGSCMTPFIGGVSGDTLGGQA